MIGTALDHGRPNPLASDASAATASVYQSRLTEYGAARTMGGYLAIPWAFSWAARGIIATPVTFGRGLLAVSNKPSEHNIYNIPTVVIVSQQLPAPQRSGNGPRLSSAMVRGRVAWIGG